MSRLPGVIAVLTGVVLGCATPGQVRQVETQVATLRAQMTRQDSARAAELGRIIALQQRILDSLQAGRETLRQFRGQVGQDFLGVQEQLVQIQELTGQSQRRLAELKRQMDDRGDQLAAQVTPPGPVVPTVDTAAAAPTTTPAAPTPDQLFQASLRELGRGSLATARLGFQEFLKTYPTHAQVPDALYFAAETFIADQPDSALVYYGQVVDRFRTSSRAPTALYKTGLLAERRQDRAGARSIYQRVLQQYPRSPEATLARDRLAALQP